MRSIFTMMGTCFNALGDIAVTAVAWALWWGLDQLYWFPLTPDPDWVLWHLAIPLTLGFLIEHGAQLASQILAGVGVGIKGEKGLTPFIIPSGVNWVVFILWNVTLSWWPITLAILLVSILVVVARARARHR